MIQREGDEAIKRYIGCAILFALPTDAVDEAFDSVSSIFQYYRALVAAPAWDFVVGERAGKQGATLLRPDIAFEE